jgi:ABC-type dipeptide/oligopeptide/nickel transport system permease subunit
VAESAQERAAIIPPRRRSSGVVGRGWRLVRDNPLGTAGAFVLLVLGFAGLFAPLVAHYAINDFAGAAGLGPNHQFWFGTDRFGEDIFSRVVFGARISLEVSFLSVMGGTVIGLMLGAFSGFKGGTIDTIVQRVVDTAIAFPALIFLLIMIQILGPSMKTVIIVITIVIIPGIARIIRSAALSERNNQYIEAARALGATDTRILMRHIIPNLVPLAIVISTTLLGTAILAEASLSFLGLGIPPPNPSWGNDISQSRNAFPINVSAAFFPGLALTLTVLGFNLLGDALRDVLDPRLRGARRA